MSRKLTASSFLIVMTLLIALKHPVLGYCLCVDSYFAGDCICQAEKPTVAPEDDPACSGCCAPESTESTESKPAEQEPCSECEEVLMVDVGDFIWHGNIEVPADSTTPASLPSYELVDLKLPAASYFSSRKTRGDPPPGLLTGAPLYLRNSVLRL